MKRAGQVATRLARPIAIDPDSRLQKMPRALLLTEATPNDSSCYRTITAAARRCWTGTVHVAASTQQAIQRHHDHHRGGLLLAVTRLRHQPCTACCAISARSVCLTFAARLHPAAKASAEAHNLSARVLDRLGAQSPSALQCATLPVRPANQPLSPTALSSSSSIICRCAHSFALSCTCPLHT